MGLPVALLAVAAGHDVVAYDPDAVRVDRLYAGTSYLADVTADRVRAALATGRFRPSTDPGVLDGFELALITVPTPVDSEGRPDLGHVEAAAKLLVVRLRPGTTVVLESSTWPGTTEEVVVPILESTGLVAGRDFHVGYSPERIDPGIGLAGIAAVPKIVAGVDGRSREVIAEFWRGVVGEVVPAVSIRSAELAKLIENVFRLVNVSLVNELAQYAGALGASVWDALALAETKPYGFMKFTPGPGAGGHCLPVDTRYLSWRIQQKSGRAPALIETASRVNDAMPTYVADRVEAGLSRRDHLQGRRTGSARILRPACRRCAAQPRCRGHHRRPDHRGCRWCSAAGHHRAGCGGGRGRRPGRAYRDRYRCNRPCSLCFRRLRPAATWPQHRTPLTAEQSRPIRSTQCRRIRCLPTSITLWSPVVQDLSEATCAGP
jgi:UDP-N-acetyl-D-glucosamine dehydrogenase